MEDAISYVLHSTISHMHMKLGNCEIAVCRLQFSFQHNSVQWSVHQAEEPRAEQLSMCVAAGLYHWQVRVSDCISRSISVNTGAPQECVLSTSLMNVWPLESVSSFWVYMGIHISEDLSWPEHVQVHTRRVKQHLHHLRQLKKFTVSSEILKTFYSGAVDSI